VSVPSLLFWVIGIPFVSVIRLRTHRRNIAELELKRNRASAAEAARLTPQQRQIAKLRLKSKPPLLSSRRGTNTNTLHDITGTLDMRRVQMSWLMEGFRETYWFWEGIVILRKVAVVLIAVASSVGEHIQTLMLCVTLMIALSLQLRYMPYASLRANRFETVSILFSLALFFFVQFLFVDGYEAHADGTESAGRSRVAVLMFATLLLYLVLFAYQVWIMSRRHIDAFVLRTRKSGLFTTLKSLGQLFDVDDLDEDDTDDEVSDHSSDTDTETSGTSYKKLCRQMARRRELRQRASNRASASNGGRVQLGGGASNASSRTSSRQSSRNSSRSSRRSTNDASSPATSKAKTSSATRPKPSSSSVSKHRGFLQRKKNAQYADSVRRMSSLATPMLASDDGDDGVGDVELSELQMTPGGTRFMSAVMHASPLASQRYNEEGGEDDDADADDDGDDDDDYYNDGKRSTAATDDVTMDFSEGDSVDDDDVTAATAGNDDSDVDDRNDDAPGSDGVARTPLYLPPTGVQLYQKSGLYPKKSDA
jgi:hypothetical protein